MGKGLEFFDAWAKTQKDFLESSLKSQEMFRSPLLESMKKAQEAFLNSAGSFDNPQIKEALKFYNMWFDMVMSSFESFSEEVLRMQKTWQKMLENQLEQSKALAKGFTDLLNQ